MCLVHPQWEEEPGAGVLPLLAQVQDPPHRQQHRQDMQQPLARGRHTSSFCDV